MVRRELMADATIEVQLSIRNTRKELFVNALNFRVFAPSSKKSDTDNLVYHLNLENAARLQVPVTGSEKDNYQYWSALRPLLEPLVQQAGVQIAASLQERKNQGK